MIMGHRGDGGPLRQPYTRQAEPDAMEAWGCPWCGQQADIEGQDRPDSQRNLQAFDAWLEGHVQECEPWLAEQGQGAC